jgi:peptide-methionine (S)-S-oxide reductase
MMKKATFALGCFWHPDEFFSKLDGVEGVLVGFIGGTTKNPSYVQVCAGSTGHAEAVEIEYDPEKISYEKLLGHFWQQHNPTQLNRQGPDVGEQYRSAIFYHDSEQKELAEKSKQALEESGIVNGSIVTQIQPAEDFYQAEEYHQKYFAKQRGEV